MENNNPDNALYFFAKELADKNIAFDEIEKQLSHKTSDQFLIAELIKKVKKEYYAGKRKKGLIKLAIGSLFLLAGFIITCINFHSDQSFTFIMYGSTCVGISFLIWALYEIVG